MCYKTWRKQILANRFKRRQIFEYLGYLYHLVAIFQENAIGKIVPY